MANVRFVERAPRELKYSHGSEDPALVPGDIETIAQIFRTPLTGAYTWSYEESDRRIRKLYRLGKERSWNAETDIDGTKPQDRTKSQRRSQRDRWRHKRTKPFPSAR